MNVYAGQVDAETLQALTMKLRPQAPFAILERVDSVDFAAGDEAIEAGAWDEGRIFGPPLEIRWACQGDGFRVVLTREDGGESEGLPLVEVLDERYERQAPAYYLWGEEDIRIGRRMDYRTIPGKGRAQLVVAEFYDEAGELRHWRYVRFQREED